MGILLSDAGHWRHLLPLTFTRPVGALRPAILTTNDSWWRQTGLPVGFATEKYLQDKFPAVKADVVREVDAALLPTPALVDAVLSLEPGQALTHHGRTLAFCRAGLEKSPASDWSSLSTWWKAKAFMGDVLAVDRPWHLFQHLGKALANDHALVTAGRTGGKLSSTNTVIGDAHLVFLEEGAVVEGCTLNTKAGPIYVGANAEIMEGSLLRGPIALGEHGQVKMGAKIYGPSAFGPECRVGGEVNNSLMMGFSNKGHDGFLGNSVLGEWCNLGADTNNSNLKNTYGPVKAWSYAEDAQVETGLTFCGLIMGDHSKSGINTMFNTGTVVGVCANVFGAGFPPKHIHSFAWGGAEGLEENAFDKAMETCKRVMDRRNVPFTVQDEAILRDIFDLSR